METVLLKLAEHGVVAIFLVLVIWYFTRREKKHEEQMIFKDKVIKAKDEKIQELNDQSRADGIDNMSLFKDVTGAMKELTVELKIRNNAG